jgi:hypothetical protein
MDSRRFRHFVLCGIFAASLSSFGPGAIDAQETAHTPKPPPKLLAPRILTSPPTLADPKRPASESVPTFVDWASRSVIGQREEARKIIVAARDNPAVAEELCREIFEVQKDDLSRSLIMLSVLGEMRNPDGGKCLARFLHQPFPKEGTVVNGEIVEQTSLGVLQAKAADGLAYAHTESGDREVLWAAGSHPSRIVRAEAINAYLWNHQDSQAARKTLLKVVRPDERSFLERPRHAPGMSREDFNRKLAEYAKMHPAPKPVPRIPGKLTIAQGVGDRPPPKVEPTPASRPPRATTEKK